MANKSVLKETREGTHKTTMDLPEGMFQDLYHMTLQESYKRGEKLSMSVIVQDALGQYLDKNYHKMEQ